MSIKTPRLIRDRCGVYYFRLIVPTALRAVIGKLELRRSLRTKDAAEARLRALELSIRVEDLMRPKISDFPHLQERDPDVRKVLIANWNTGEFRADTPAELKQLAQITSTATLFHEAVAKNAAARGTMAALPVTRTGVLLAPTIKDFLAERSGTLKRATIAKHKTALNAFLEAHGNVDVGTLQNDDTAKTYKQTLVAQLKASSVNDHVGVLIQFFKYTHNNTNAKVSNPWLTRRVAGAKNLTESYELFEPEELERIFLPIPYLGSTKLPDFYWGPLIALFTGARAEEIANLEIKNVRQESGIFYFQIVKGGIPPISRTHS